MPLTQQEVLAKLAKGEPLKDQEIGDVDFSGYCFKKHINFSRTIFKGEKIFSKTKFLQGAEFSKAKFISKGRVNFKYAIFSGEGGTSFKGATFSAKGGTNFNHSKFYGTKPVIFSYAKFLNEGNVYFHNTRFNQECLVYFDHVQTKNPKNVKFMNVDLGNTSFYLTDIEEFSFKNVKFRQIGTRQGLADEVWEEIKPEGRADRKIDRNYYNHVETLYRQLKRNFEEKRDYARAGDFHYGEMEMRRKQEPPLKPSLTFLYKWISGYGERWLRALGWFLGFLALFTVLNLFLIYPVKNAAPPNSKKEIVECKKQLSLCPGVGLSDSLFFTLNTMTLQKDPDFKVKPTFLGARGQSFFNFRGRDHHRPHAPRHPAAVPAVTRTVNSKFFHRGERKGRKGRHKQKGFWMPASAGMTLPPFYKGGV